MCLTIGQEKNQTFRYSDMMSKVDIMSTIYIKFHELRPFNIFSVGTTVDLAPPKSSCPLKQKENISLMHLCSTGGTELGRYQHLRYLEGWRRTCDENIVVHTTTMGCRCLISKLVRRNLDTINLERGSTPQSNL